MRSDQTVTLKIIIVCVVLKICHIDEC